MPCILRSVIRDIPWHAEFALIKLRCEECVINVIWCGQHAMHITLCYSWYPLACGVRNDTRATLCVIGPGMHDMLWYVCCALLCVVTHVTPLLVIPASLDLHHCKNWVWLNTRANLYPLVLVFCTIVNITALTNVPNALTLMSRL